uniref:Suppressor of white apricot N-terminal domain-containing protein n=1 Tax=Anopheles culicifacies TaxID=139723 RepID=A0A182LS26_9DIPT
MRDDECFTPSMEDETNADDAYDELRAGFKELYDEIDFLGEQATLTVQSLTHADANDPEVLQKSDIEELIVYARKFVRETRKTIVTFDEHGVQCEPAKQSNKKVSTPKAWLKPEPEKYIVRDEWREYSFRNQCAITVTQDAPRNIASVLSDEAEQLNNKVTVATAPEVRSIGTNVNFVTQRTVAKKANVPRFNQPSAARSAKCASACELRPQPVIKLRAPPSTAPAVTASKQGRPSRRTFSDEQFKLLFDRFIQMQAVKHASEAPQKEPPDTQNVTNEQENEATISKEQNEELPVSIQNKDSDPHFGATDKEDKDPIEDLPCQDKVSDPADVDIETAGFTSHVLPVSSIPALQSPPELNCRDESSESEHETTFNDHSSRQFLKSLRIWKSALETQSQNMKITNELTENLDLLKDNIEKIAQESSKVAQITKNAENTVQDEHIFTRPRVPVPAGSSTLRSKSCECFGCQRTFEEPALRPMTSPAYGHKQFQRAIFEHNPRMPWQGQKDNLIDRFDVRAHLDYIPPVPRTNADQQEQLEDDAEERAMNYERYRVLAQNEFLGIVEEKYLHQLYLEEQFGVNAQIEAETKAAAAAAKKKSTAGAAIGYTYEETETVPGGSGSSLGSGGIGTGSVPFVQSITAIEKASESSATLASTSGPAAARFDECMKDDSDSDLDMDVSIDINKIGTNQAHELNTCGRQYGMKSNDFYSFLTKDADEADALRMAREEEQEKIMFSGRKSRRERRAQRERKVAGRPLSPPSYAAKEELVPRTFVDANDSSRSPSPVNSGKITYITSFGGEEELQPHGKISFGFSREMSTLGGIAGSSKAARMRAEAAGGVGGETSGTLSYADKAFENEIAITLTIKVPVSFAHPFESISLESETKVSSWAIVDPAQGYSVAIVLFLFIIYLIVAITLQNARSSFPSVACKTKIGCRIG